MGLILASWLIMGAFFSVWGVAASKWLRLSTPTGGFLFMGMVLQTLLLTLAAFFVPLNEFTFLANTALTSLIAWMFRRDIAAHLGDAWRKTLTLTRVSRLLLGLGLFVSLWKSAQLPFIVDNDTYYLQTIKWLHEYGIVKGLANFNVAYGQTSPWHILQSGFDLPFTGWPLNDLNGFAFLSFLFILLTLKQQVNTLYILVFSFILLQFVSTPSPDLPVVLALFLAFIAYGDRESKWCAVLVVYAIFLKVTALPFTLLLCWLIWKRDLSVRFTSGVSLPFVALWVAKNVWVSGYPFFPSTSVALDLGWTVPKQVASSLADMIRNHEFREHLNYRTFGWIDRLLAWLKIGGIERVFNWGMLLAFCMAPFLCWQDKRFRVVYAVSLVHLVFILLVSPQYRFFLPEFLFLWTLIIGTWLRKKFFSTNMISGLLVTSLIVPLVLPLLLNGRALTGNGKMALNDQYTMATLLFPQPITRHAGLRFEKDRIGNLLYWTPPKDANFHTTGDGPLPCTNRRIIQSNARKYGIIPQLRTGRLRDGFQSTAANEWDRTN